MGAPLGNRNGCKENRAWSEEIRKAATQRKRLRKLAEALLDKCEEGDVSALKEFGDRFDGKVAQQIVGPGGEGEHTIITRIEEVIVDPNR